MPEPVASTESEESPKGWGELVEALGGFGLSTKEASLYLAGLRRGRATARELAIEVGIDRVFGYRLLNSMRTRGIVDVTSERPRRFSVTPARELLARVLQDRRDALTRDEHQGHILPALLDRMQGSDEAGATRYQILAGTERVNELLHQMLGRAEEEIDVLATQRGLRESFQAALHRDLRPFLSRGGRFRLIAESDPRISGLLRRFAALSHGHPGTEVRQLSPQPSRVTIIDQRETLVFLVPDAHMGRVEQIAVWTNNRDFVSSQLLYFGAMWDAAGRAARGSQSETPRPGTPPSVHRRARRKRIVFGDRV